MCVRGTELLERCLKLEVPAVLSGRQLMLEILTGLISAGALRASNCGESSRWNVVPSGMDGLNRATGAMTKRQPCKGLSMNQTVRSDLYGVANVEARASRVCCESC